MGWTGGPSAGPGGLAAAVEFTLTEAEFCQVVQMA
jgi:hypothetical protein